MEPWFPLHFIEDPAERVKEGRERCGPNLEPLSTRKRVRARVRERSAVLVSTFLWLVTLTARAPDRSKKAEWTKHTALENQQSSRTPRAADNFCSTGAE